MNRYYVRYPRNFSNEYSVYVVEAGSGAEQKLLTYVSNLDRITRRIALYLGKQIPRKARETGQQWFGGFVGGPHYGGDPIVDAALNTIELVEDLERHLA